MTPLFNVILIETHNACTRSCWFCKFGQTRHDPGPSEMDWSTIDRIVGNLHDLNYDGRISWFWINEPLMDARIVDIINLTRRRCPRAFLSLVTNGDLLSETLYEELRHNGLDALGVSIYDTRGAQQVSQLKPDEQLVLMDMRKMRPMSLENRGGNIKRHARLFQSAQERYESKGCERPFRMMTVNSKGHAVLCCSDLYSDVVMGDVAEHRLEQIWNNDLFTHYRSHLAEKGRKGLRLCDGCSYNGGASPMHYPLKAPLDRSHA